MDTQIGLFRRQARWEMVRAAAFGAGAATGGKGQL